MKYNIWNIQVNTFRSYKYINSQYVRNTIFSFLPWRIPMDRLSHFSGHWPDFWNHWDSYWRGQPNALLCRKGAWSRPNRSDEGKVISRKLLRKMQPNQCTIGTIATTEQCVAGMETNWSTYLLNELLAHAINPQEKGSRFTYSWLLILASNHLT